MAHWTYREEMVRCGKRNCRSCPHGPYWYRYNHVKGKTRKEYIGKKRPDFLQEKQDPAERDPDEIFDPRKRDYKLATFIFGLDTNSYISAKTWYRRRAAELHPDRNPGEGDKAFKRLGAAWEYIKIYWNWEGAGQKIL